MLNFRQEREIGRRTQRPGVLGRGVTQMRRLHDVWEAEGKPIRKGDAVVVYFPPTGSSPQGAPIFPVLKGKMVRADAEALVIDREGQTIAFSWDHIAGLQVE